MSRSRLFVLTDAPLLAEPAAVEDVAAKQQLMAISFRVTMVVAILICAVFIITQFISRKTKESKGYTVDSRAGFISRLVYNKPFLIKTKNEKYKQLIKLKNESEHKNAA